jgi:glycosyltransferase involved in cell wall biosynthesis
MRKMRAEGLEAIKDKLKPGRYLPPSSGVNFEHLVDEMREAAVRTGWKPELIIFLYLDMMRQDPPSLAPLEEYGVPFAGILFHPKGSYADGKFRPERYFLCKNARGAIFLNPEPLDDYHKRFPKLRFESFPDVTDDSTLGEPTEFVRSIRERAGHRTVVLQLGTLSPHKGLFELVDLVKRADPKRFFFTIVGEVMWDHYGDRREELREFLENPPENCAVHLGYLEDPREMNALIQSADVLYAVYKGDFKNSSNTITKAAVFQKPILVGDQFLMAQRVRQYGIGETVKSGDIDGALFWLEEVAERPKERFGFVTCARDHSIERLNEVLPRLVAQWLPPSSRGQ